MNKRRFRLSDITDDQLLELMESVSSDEQREISSDDDDDYDPTFDLMEINADDARCISMCIGDMNVAETSDIFLPDVNMLMNVTDIENDAISILDEGPSTSAAAALRSSTLRRSAVPASRTPKRVRSPLPSFEVSGPTIVPSSGGFTGSNLHDICKDSKEFSKITWRQDLMCLRVNELAFQGDSNLPDAVKNLETPMDFFIYFFTRDIMQMIATETNRAALSENINTNFKVTADDIYNYIGILMYMSIYVYPNLESYWGNHAFAPIQQTMSIK